MIVAKLQGGLGNQMFQYAAGKFLANKLKTELLLECSSLEISSQIADFTPRSFELDIFKLKAKIASKKNIDTFNNSLVNRIKRIFYLPYCKTFVETNYFYDHRFDNVRAPAFLIGFYQSEKYFQSIREELIAEFAFPDVLDNHNKLLVTEIISNNSVSIHVRRGDYVNAKIASSFHGTCEINYYLKSIDLITKKTSVDKFYIFSDDIHWAKENLELDDRFLTVNNEHSANWIDMYLMSICKHHIIANSSYSWWAAWLNTNANKIVIAPKQWLKTDQYDTSHITPETWIKI